MDADCHRATLQHPRRPISVLVRESLGWTLADLIAWRWTNRDSRSWEGLVEFGGGREKGWIDSDHLLKLASNASA